MTISGDVIGEVITISNDAIDEVESFKYLESFGILAWM